MRRPPRSPLLGALAALAALAVLAVLTLASPPAAAQQEEGPRLSVQVDRPRPAADDSLQVTFSFHGIGTFAGVRAPASLPLKNLQTAGGPFQSTSVNIVNGDVRKAVSLTWRLRPLGPGPAEIGETQWFVGDKAVRGAPVTLEVGPPRRGAGSQGSVVPDEEEDPFASRFRGIERGMPPGARPREGLVNYTVTADKTTAWVGEEIVLTYDLVVSAVDVLNLEFVEPPKFPGFWAEDLERPEKPQGRPDTVEGRKVVRFLLMKKAVAGLSPGSFSIPPAKVRLAVRVNADPFADPFAMLRPQIVDRETPALSLKILPIPGRPDFKGPVGRFDLSATVDRDHVAAGEAFTLKVKASGTGSLRTAADAPVLEIPGARVYPPTTKSGSSRAGGRPAATADWEYVVVPTVPGPLVVPPLGIEVFDTTQKAIVRRTTKPINVVVGPALAGASSASASASAPGTPSASPSSPSSPEAQTTLPKLSEAGPASSAAKRAGPRPSPSPSVDLANGTVTVSFRTVLGTILAVAVAAAIALRLRRRRRSRATFAATLEPEPGETKERVASRIDRALREALARVGIPDGASAGRTLELLAEARLEPATIEEVRALLEDLDFLRFAPQLGDYADRISSTRAAAARLLPKLQEASRRRPPAI